MRLPTVRAAWSSVLAALAVPLATVGAQSSWSETVNGNYRYATNFATSGQFGCGPASHYLTGSCTASGSTLTIQNGSSWMTLAFTGTAGPVSVSNEFSQTFELGRIDKTFGGSGVFALPQTRSSGHVMFSFGLSLSTSSPIAATVDFGVPFFGEEFGSAYHASVPSYRRLPLQPLPNGNRRYELMWHDMDRRTTGTTIRAGDVTPLILRAQVSVVPEPGTVTLLGTGLLLGAAAMARRSRRS